MASRRLAVEVAVPVVDNNVYFQLVSTVIYYVVCVLWVCYLYNCGLSFIYTYYFLWIIRLVLVHK